MALWISSEGSVLLPPLALGSWSVEGYLWQPPLVGMGATPSPILQTLGLFFPALAQAHGVLQGSW